MAFTDTVNALADDPDLRVLIVTGEGDRAFMGGANLHELGALDPTKARDFLKLVHMPDYAMRLPAQTSAAQASYGPEDRRIPVSQPGTGALVASYKKEVGLVPISNDLMRFADPAIDAFVRDDLVKVMALREDLAFLIGDGTQDSPRGFLSFANARAVATGGTPGNWLTTGNSTLAVGGNFITSNETYTLATVATEIPRAPEASCRRATSGHLWVLAWGRKWQPSRRQ